MPALLLQDLLVQLIVLALEGIESLCHLVKFLKLLSVRLLAVLLLFLQRLGLLLNAIELLSLQLY